MDPQEYHYPHRYQTTLSLPPRLYLLCMPHEQFHAVSLSQYKRFSETTPLQFAAAELGDPSHRYASTRGTGSLPYRTHIGVVLTSANLLSRRRYQAVNSCSNRTIMCPRCKFGMIQTSDPGYLSRDLGWCICTRLGLGRPGLGSGRASRLGT